MRFGLHKTAAIAVSLLALSLSACASRPEFGSLSPTSVAAPGAREETILVATSRQRDARPGTLFNGERSPVLNFAQVAISIPPTHAPGKVEAPQQAPGDPRTEIVVRGAHYLDDEKAFVAAVNHRLASKPKGQRRVLLFVHGYNTMFAEGLYRLAQIASDSGGNAVPVHFSWASRGKLLDYVYDNNSATSARDELERTLKLLVSSNAEEINVLAHSMGNWATVEAFRQIRIAGDGASSNKIGHIILAAPDIDIDVFKAQMRRIGKPRKPFYIVLSRDDRALGFSRFLAGKKERLGSYKEESELTALGAVVIDLTDVESADSTNHSKFAEIAPNLREVLARGIGRPGGAQGELAEDVMSAPIGLLDLPMRIFSAR